MSQMLHDDRANGMFSCKLVRGEGDLRKATGIGRGILAYNTVSRFRHIDTSVFGNATCRFTNREATYHSSGSAGRSKRNLPSVD